MQISYTFHISSKNNAITTVKKLSTASKHNMRKYSSPGNQTGHYDSGKIVQLAGTDNLFRDVEKVYHEQFDQALADYNKKQKRTDRKILDYMRYVSENGKSDLAVEAIIQLGDREFWENIPELQKRQMTYIFKDQLNALRQHLPEFVIANAVIHFDESSPHMHVIGVPVSSGYKRGLSKQCAKTRVFTKDSLEKLQNVLRRRALKGMEKNPEIFSNSSLKSKEAGRNSDYSKEYYVQKKKEELEDVEQKLAAKHLTLSEVEEKTEIAKELLRNTTAELTRKEQETFALVPFRKNDVFPVQGKMKKVLAINDNLRAVLMCDADTAIFSPREKLYPLALAQKSFFEYMYSDIGLQQVRRNMEQAKMLRKEQEKEQSVFEAETQELERTKKDLSILKQDVEALSDIKCPFQIGDRFEIDGEMATVSCIYEFSRKVSFQTESRQRKEIPLLDAIRAYNSFLHKEELTNEYTLLKQKIADLKEEWKRRTQVLAEIDTVLSVFRHFPAIKDFILKLGKMIKMSFGRVSLEDIKEAFKETVLGEKKQKPDQDLEQKRTRGRIR